MLSTEKVRVPPEFMQVIHTVSINPNGIFIKLLITKGEVVDIER